jgi:hypothetical protein
MYDFRRILSWPFLQEKLAEIFSPTAGHDHDGTNSKALAADAVGTTQMADTSVTAAKLAADAVETAKIKDAAVTAAKLAVALQALALGVASGYKIARGVTEVTGTTEVTTGLATIVALVPALAADVSLNASAVSVTIPTQTGGDAGKATLKAWKPTATDNCTPIASTTATSVAWIAIGT